MAASEYDFPDGQQGITYLPTVFNFTINGSGLNLTGAYVEIDIFTDLQAPCSVTNFNTSGSGIVITAPTGQLLFSPGIISLNAGQYVYEMNMYLNDGSVQQYLTGSWNIDG